MSCGCTCIFDLELSLIFGEETTVNPDKASASDFACASLRLGMVQPRTEVA